MELCLASSSFRADHLDEYDKVFRVPQSTERLPGCTRGEISPLRNRVIAESVSRVPEVQTFLKSVKDYIDTELSKVERLSVDQTSDGVGSLPVKEQEGRLCVCICCSTGTHISPCCVERLHEVYSRRPLVLSNLVVRRQHRRAEVWAREMRGRHNLVWQQTLMPIKYFRNPAELRNDRMWGTVPLEILPLIEEEFQKDPLNSACKLGKDGAKCSHQVDFVAGELYSHRDMKTYRLRCVIRDIETKVECRMLDGPSYKTIGRRYGAAGVLFYSTHPITGEAIFLLGHMNYSTESWCDFGGLKSFREKPRHTAARECEEETLGVLGGEEELYKLLGDYKNNHVFKVVNQSTAYVCHFLCIAYGDYPDQFTRASLDHDETLEVDELKWFSLSSLREVMKMFFMDYQTLRAYSVLLDGSLDTETSHRMRVEFVQTLCIAEKLNILHSIEHITGHIHRQTLPATRTGDHTMEVDGLIELEHECCMGEDGARNLATADHRTIQEDRGHQHLKTENADITNKERRSEESKLGDSCGATAPVKGNSHVEEHKDVQESCHQGDGEVAVKRAPNSTCCLQRHCQFIKFGMGAGQILV